MQYPRSGIYILLITARDLIVAVVAVVLAAPIWLLPWDAAIWSARRYAELAFWLWPSARRTAMINLRRAYGPSMSYEQARSWTREIFRNLGQSLAEGLQFSRRYRFRQTGWEALAETTDPLLAARLAQDPRPKIFVTAHLGSWEVATVLLSLLVPGPGAAIARRVDNPFLNYLVRRQRFRSRSQWIEKRGAVEEALQRIRRGENVALLMDENGGWKGPFVEFFGRPASTRKTAALLSLSTGAPVVLGVLVRRPQNVRFLFELAVIEPAPYTGNPASILAMTQDIAKIQEAWIREYPLQWRWIHWRWKSRPGGVEETYTRQDLARCFQLGRAAIEQCRDCKERTLRHGRGYSRGGVP